jgi:hypothetical protein
MKQSNGFGSEFQAQADVMGGGSSAISFWPILGILVLAVIVAFIAYKILLD